MMSRITIVTGVLLILLGIGFFLGTGRTHVTSLIPSFVGAALLVAGLISLNEKIRKHAAHVAALIGTLGALAGLGKGIQGLIAKGMSAGTIGSLIMGIVCAIYVVMCIRSFKAARLAREAGAAS